MLASWLPYDRALAHLRDLRRSPDAGTVRFRAPLDVTLILPRRRAPPGRRSAAVSWGRAAGGVRALPCAVLGELSNVFTVAAGEAAYQSFLTEPRAFNVTGVAVIFAAHQVPLVSGAKVTAEDSVRAWQVQDDQRTFTVLLITATTTLGTR
jgi:hypothetical protein